MIFSRDDRCCSFPFLSMKKSSLLILNTLMSAGFLVKLIGQRPLIHDASAVVTLNDVSIGGEEDG